MARFEGTPWECLAWLDGYFSIMRNVTEGAKDVSDDKEYYESLLDVLDRSVYTVTVEPMKGMVAPYTARPENSYAAMRMRTSLELFDAIQRHGTNKGTIDDDTNDNNV